MTELRTITIHPVVPDVKSLAASLCAFLNRAGLSVAVRNEFPDPRDCRTLIVVGLSCRSELTSTLERCHDFQRLLILAEDSRTFNLEAVSQFFGRGVADVIFCRHCDPHKEILIRLERWAIVDALMESEALRGIVGRQQQWLRQLQRIVEVAAFTNDSVLLSGESGTGKELVARLIHNLDRREAKSNYTIVDCTTVNEGLSGSEFFGHERGAFTSAYADRDGAFAIADGGTLFLDEIGELSLPLQAQLLRVIQEGTYRRIGSNVWQRTQFRLICATNRDLLEEIAAGRFRRDLYYRIAQWTFKLPSLHERRQDITALANYFLNDNREDGRKITFDPIVEAFLSQRSYPGNIRELRQLVHKMKNLLKSGDVITAGSIPRDEWEQFTMLDHPAETCQYPSPLASALSSNIGLTEIVNRVRTEAIKQVLQEELALVNFDLRKKAVVLRRTSERLKCSLRWVQICAKNNGLVSEKPSGDH